MRVAGLILLAPLAALAGEDAAGMYRARCAACHAIPDPALRTDRAWLDQVNRTT